MASINMTGNNLEMYYSSVISLSSMHNVVLLAELDNIETHAGDISNTYLTARTTDKIIFNSVPEFEPFGHVGHLLLIKISLYGLNSSGARFYYRLSDSLKTLGFVHYMGGYDICM